MNNIRVPFFLLLLLVSTHLFGQLKLKLEQLPAGDWGVFVLHCSDVPASDNCITGSGQITIVAPYNATISGLTNHAGTWANNAIVTSPGEAPDKLYYSVGFLNDLPEIYYSSEEETLLFSLSVTSGSGVLPYLMDNEQDPFNQLPNSFGTNPGNELSVIDLGVTPTGFYAYTGNYLPGEVACQQDTVIQDTTGTNPGDTTVVNPNDTTVVNPNDTTVVNPGDTTIINPNDTTVVNPGDTTNIDTTGQNPSATSDTHVQESWFSLSPNPAFDWMSITFEKNVPAGAATIRLWTIRGVPVGKVEKGPGDILRLNVNELHSGMYILTLEQEGRVLQRKRFVKQ